ncbi:HlyD family efflux transporter periplasmic adaptor subunit, partial [Lysobacter maris]
LEHGTRGERVAQGRAAEVAASAEAAVQQVTLDKLSLVAPRDAIVESLPYKLGDQAPVGAPLALLLVGEAPHARVYVPEPVRAGIRVGQPAKVRVEGLDAEFDGHVRMIRSEPSFTPYYALTGEDAARLSYLAEIALEGEAARELAVGLPVQVRFLPQRDGDRAGAAR